MKILIVDGYNVIRSTGAYAHIATDEWELAREALIADVAAYAQGEFDRAVVVFDGGGNPFSEGRPQNIAGIEVVFSKQGTSADSAIEKLSSEAKAHGDKVVVISSDATVQWTTMGKGSTRMSALGFLDESSLDEEGRQGKHVAGSKKAPLKERLSDDAQEKLKSLRDELD